MMAILLTFAEGVRALNPSFSASVHFSILFLSPLILVSQGQVRVGTSKFRLLPHVEHVCMCTLCWSRHSGLPSVQCPVDNHSSSCNASTVLKGIGLSAELSWSWLLQGCVFSRSGSDLPHGDHTSHCLSLNSSKWYLGCNRAERFLPTLMGFNLSSVSCSCCIFCSLPLQLMFAI